MKEYHRSEIQKLRVKMKKQQAYMERELTKLGKEFERKGKITLDNEDYMTTYPNGNRNDSKCHKAYRR